jgi:poly(3-hydroxybutyrate) depolymerase
MTVEGELDDISGVGQTFASHGLCSGLPPAKRRHLMQKQVGHFGIFNGKKWRADILPQVTEFIRANQGQAMKRAG